MLHSNIMPQLLTLPDDLLHWAEAYCESIVPLALTCRRCYHLLRFRRVRIRLCGRKSAGRVATVSPSVQVLRVWHYDAAGLRSLARTSAPHLQELRLYDEGISIPVGTRGSAPALAGRIGPPFIFIGW